MDINAVLKVGFSQYQQGQLNDDCLHAYFCGALNAFLTIGADKSDLIKALEQYANVSTVASLIKPKQSQSDNKTKQLQFDCDLKHLTNLSVYESLSAEAKPWDKAIVKTSNGLEPVKKIAVFPVNGKHRVVIIAESGGK